MTAVLLRKDAREIGPSAVALTLLGAFCLAMIRAFVSPYESAAPAILVCLLWTCALVTSVQPFAHEFESGTIAWLDALPSTRLSVWRSKAVGTAVTVLLQLVVLVATFALLGLKSEEGIPATAAWALVAAANGWASGLCGSALARSSLGAVGWAVLVQNVAIAVAFVVGAPLASVYSSEPGPVLGFIVGLLAVPVPLAISRRAFTRLDRLRHPARQRQCATSRRWVGERALAWLAWRQVRIVAYVAIAVALVVGIVIPVTLPGLWPLVGYTIGGVLGVAAFAGDQSGEAFRFLGERRLPPRRVWLVKLAVTGGLVAAAILPAALGLVSRIVAAKFALSSQYTDRSGAPARALAQLLVPAIQLLGPLYGFAVGQFFGLTQRKLAVAVVLTAAVGAALAFALGPSVLVGGFAMWQWLLPPFVLLAATALAARPWVSGRLATMRPFVGLVGAFVGFGLLVAAGVWARATEVPDRGPPFDILAYQRSLPTPEANESGRRIRAIAAKFIEFAKTLPLFSDMRLAAVGTVLRGDQTPVDDGETAAFAAAAAKGPWHDELREAVRLPLGRIDAMSASQSHPNFELLLQLRSMGELEVVEAPRLAAAGDLAASLDRAITALRLGRHMRSKANGQQFIAGILVESAALRQIVTTFERPGATEDQLRRALRELVENERESPEAADAIKADYLTMTEAIAFGSLFVPSDTGTNGQLRRAARLVPWERDRQQRLLALTIAGYLRILAVPYEDAMRAVSTNGVISPAHHYALTAWMPETGGVERERFGRWLSTAVWSESSLVAAALVPSYAINGMTQRRAAVLLVALALSERMHGKPAAKLDDLVPDLIPVVPIDPADGKPFRYRLVGDEPIAAGHDVGPAGPAPRRAVKPGQGLVWSVGPDGIDGGGVLQAQPYSFTYVEPIVPGDLIFQVPRAPK